jgi:transcriptional regulator with XRE-family HTH domain
LLQLRIKEVAQAKGVGLAKLSRLADISYKTIQKLWRNPSHNALLSTLNRIAKVLNVAALELLEDVPEDQVAGRDRIRKEAAASTGKSSKNKKDEEMGNRTVMLPSKKDTAPLASQGSKGGRQKTTQG